MGKVARFVGLDFFRSLAVLSVIILHIDEPLQDIPLGWRIILSYAYFPVPFFLAASFFLAFQGLNATSKRFPLRKRAKRLLIPYVVWSIIYLLFKCAKYLTLHEKSRIVLIFSDPWALLFFGGSAFHLYFLPLLFVGTLLVNPISGLSRHLSRKIPFNVKNIVWLFLILFSIGIYNLLIASGNTFDNAQGIAFSSISDSLHLDFTENVPARVLAVYLSWLFRCVPYLLISSVLAQDELLSYIFRNKWFCLIVSLLGFWVAATFSTSVRFGGVLEILRGYSSLLLGLSITDYPVKSLKRSLLSLLSRASLYSFGIYLIHLLILDIFYALLNKIFPSIFINISSFHLVFFALFVFLCSYYVVEILSRSKFISSILFVK